MKKKLLLIMLLLFPFCRSLPAALYKILGWYVSAELESDGSFDWLFPGSYITFLCVLLWRNKENYREQQGSRHCINGNRNGSHSRRAGIGGKVECCTLSGNRRRDGIHRIDAARAGAKFRQSSLIRR